MPVMEDDLASFLSRHTPLAQEMTVWGVSPLRVVSYLLAPADKPPPQALVTSVRAIVLRGDTVLTLRNRDTTHIVPGGQREGGEMAEATLRREVLEETGWTLDAPALLGFMHFRHLGPKPSGHPYLYPDFVQIVFLAEAAVYLPDALLPDDYNWRPISARLPRRGRPLSPPASGSFSTRRCGAGGRSGRAGERDGGSCRPEPRGMDVQFGHGDGMIHAGEAAL